jgi:hypothetical protein
VTAASVTAAATATTVQQRDNSDIYGEWQHQQLGMTSTVREPEQVRGGNEQSSTISSKTGIEWL